MGRLDGRCALITGAGSGIGRESALLFAAEGASVLVADRDADAGRTTAGAIRDAGGVAEFAHVDVTRGDEVAAAVATAESRFGALHVLFNNAGVFPDADGSPVDTSEAVFDFVGAQPTLDMSRDVVAIDGYIHIVGIGGGVLPTGFFATPFGAAVRAPYWGTRSELQEVFDLARAGAVSVHVERYGIDDAVAAYRKLHDGTVRGRAVVVPS